MRYHSDHYILEYWNKITKSYVECGWNKNPEWLKKLAKKSYYQYDYMGKKRIRFISTKIVWTSE